MNLTEHQAKNILRDARVRIPRGGLAKSVEESSRIASDLNLPKFVVKAQIQAGGRAQGYFKNDSQSRGGIRVVESVAQVKACAAQMIGNVLVTDQTGLAGERVNSVYIEEFVQVGDEKYIALCIDSDTGSLSFVASNEGGVGIESLAQQSPELIKRFPVDIANPQVPTKINEFLGFDANAAAECNQMLDTLLSIFIDKDATLIELNPIGLNEHDELSVLDAAIAWDDNALFRQGHEEQMVAYDHLPASEFKAKCLGLNYVHFSGNVGTVSAGAGLAMAVIDALNDAELKPANFLDIPPSSSVDVIRQAIELVLHNQSVNVLFINIIGGGIMRCDAVADAILVINEQQNIAVPMVVRLAGTNASLANQRLSASLPDIYVTSDFADAMEAVTGVSAALASKSEAKPHKSWWQRVVNIRETSST